MKWDIRSILVSVFFGLSFILIIGLVEPAKANEIGEGANGSVSVIVVQPDGKILLGGEFTRIHGRARTNLARLNVDGSLDQDFRAAANAPISTIAIQSNGKILVGGYFSELGGVSRNNLGRLNEDGSVDMAYDPSPGDAVTVLLVEPNDKLLVGGIFSAISTRNGTGSLVRLNKDGSFHTNFTHANVGLASLARQLDGKVIAGPFSSIFSTIDRFNYDGTIDESFGASVGEGSVTDIELQSNGKIIVSGTYSRLNNIIVDPIARLNSNGSLDTTFKIPKLEHRYSMNIWDALIQPDGKILIGGTFGLFGQHELQSIRRLNQDGSFDNAFPATASNFVGVLSAQSDNKILVGGVFEVLNGKPRGRFGRLNPDGTLDESFPMKGDYAVTLPPYMLLLD